MRRTITVGIWVAFFQECQQNRANREEIGVVGELSQAPSRLAACLNELSDAVKLKERAGRRLEQ